MISEPYTNHTVPAVVVIGGGPAGLTAAHELTNHGIRSDVFEAGSTVGGLSRTVEYKGFLFDIGGHRFFTKVRMVEDLWREILGPEFLKRPRLSRIHYKGSFFSYPLELRNVIGNLGIVESALCGLSFLFARLFPRTPEDDFETWVRNRFGTRLYRTFFKTYTEKVWGIPCTEIRAEWAAQRIRGLSLSTAVWEALRHQRSDAGAKLIKTLIHEFEYPRLGPGMMWTEMARVLENRGCSVNTDSPVDRIDWKPGRVLSLTSRGRTYRADQFISSMPLRHLIRALTPAPPAAVLQAAQQLHYRDFLTVALIVKRKDLFPDNWIYVHDPDLHVGRIQNYKNWSADMVPDQDLTCLGLEYFCAKGDELWSLSDSELLALAAREVEALGLAPASDVIDGTVVRVPKAYPVYDRTYRDSLATIREFLDTLPNLQVIGRNGMHHYNNQDHSMLTGIFAARNIAGAKYALWEVNEDAEYHEERSGPDGQLAALSASQPRVPATVSEG